MSFLDTISPSLSHSLTPNYRSLPPSLGDLLLPSLVYALLHGLLALGFLEPLFYHFGKRVMIYMKGVKFYQENKSRVSKFSSEFFSYVCHITVLIYLWIHIRHYRWYQTPHIIGVTFPAHIRYSFEIRQVYCCSIGFYVYSTIVMCFRRFLICPETAKIDFMEMFFHHILTLALLFNSYLAGYAPAAISTLLNHNMADMFTYPLRLANYVKVRPVAVAFLPVCTIVWCYLRLYQFPYYLIGGGLCGFKYGQLYIENILWGGFEHTIFGLMMTSLSVVLYFLHVYWWYAMLYIIYEVVHGSNKWK